MIETKELTKCFGDRVVVDDISFSVARGEVLGFLGPNAAGKSTTMRMITGFLPPTAGTAVVGGYDITRDSLAARRKIGYLPENAPAYPDMTVYGFLDFIARIRGFSGAGRRSRIEGTLRRCFLEAVRHQPINTLSKGFKQRVCFAQSILHDPEYLIMDEPTDGLDPNQKSEVRAMIREMAREKTIILSTHILEEVEELCTRVIIISDGRIVADDTADGLKSRSSIYGALRLTVKQAGERDMAAEMAALSPVERTEVISEDNGRISLRIYPKETSPPPADEILGYLQREGLHIEAFQIEEGRLDEVFRMVTSAGSTEKTT
ncbi:MAG: ABC transporter ATP-binding protein [Deltaproteobacteria bacterium]|nr:ABC transporter ATP-binding protein [Deltaproteobacteria bacterium]